MARDLADTFRRLAAQHAATRALVESETLEQAAPRVLEAVGGELGWPLGVLWLIDASGRELVPREVWRAREGLAEAFVEATRRARFERGAGLPGRVWASGEPAWIPDLGRDPNFPRLPAAAAAGLNAALAFPVRLGAEPIGVMEFFSPEPEEPDELLLDTLASIGGQIGLFVQRRRALGQVAASEARFRLLAQTSPDAIVTIDQASRILFANPAAERIFGWSPDELVGRRLTDLMPERLRAGHHAGLRRYIETGRKHMPWNGIELPGLTRDGREIPLEISFGEYVEDGRRIFTGFIRDISERLEQQRELEATAAELETTVEELRTTSEAERRAHEAAEEAARWSAFLAAAGRTLASSLDYETTLSSVARLAVPEFADLCVVDVLDDGHVRRVEAAHADASARAAGRELERRFPPDPDAPMGPARVARTGRPELLGDFSDDEAASREAGDEAEAHARLREAGVVSSMIVPLRARGRSLGAIAFVSTDRERVYDRDDLDRAQDLARRCAFAIDNARLYEAAVSANSAKSDFLAVMSHELRTPLTAVMGYADLLDAEIAGALNDGQHRQVERIKTSAQHLLALIDQVLTFARAEADREPVQVESIDAAELARSTALLMEPVAEQKGLRFEIRVPDEPIPMTTDRAKLRQIVLNLLSNAVKFTESGEVALEAAARDGRLVLDVCDTGIGIPEDRTIEIFEPFRQLEAAMTRRAGGTGLGLAVAQRLTRLLGGTIEVRSEPGHGSVFRLSVPLGSEAGGA